MLFIFLNRAKKIAGMRIFNQLWSEATRYVERQFAVVKLNLKNIHPNKDTFQIIS